MRIIVGISGASGVVMGYRIILALKRIPDCEVHLVISQAGLKNFQLETDLNIEEVKGLADYYYEDHNLAASISAVPLSPMV